jgi:hypothetical protein
MGGEGLGILFFETKLMMRVILMGSREWIFKMFGFGVMESRY